MKRILRFPLHSLVAVAFLLALAVPAAPAWGQTTSATNTGQIMIDVPAAGSTVSNGSRVLIGGWAIDPAGPGTGIDQVRVYLDGMMDAGGTLLGSATTGGPRPDVATLLGNPAFRDSGFDFFWMPTNLSSGNHTIHVYAHSTGSNSWSYKSVTVNVVGGPTSGGDRYRPDHDMGSGRQGMTGREGMQYPHDLMDQGRARACMLMFPPGPGCERFVPPPPPPPPPPPLYPVIPAVPAVPVPPVVGLPAPLSVTPASVTGTTVTLIWAPVTGAASYRVLQSTAGGPYVQATVANISPVSATVTGLLPLTTYSFQVVAVDALGAQGTPSTPVPVTTTLGFP